jgi:hypothetical protein
MNKISESRKWHLSEQARIAKEVKPVRTEEVETVRTITWGRPKRRINRKPGQKGDLVTEIARTVKG